MRTNWGYIHPEREAVFGKDGSFRGIMCKVPEGGTLDSLDKCIDRIVAKLRTKVEHSFRVSRRRLGHAKTGRCGLTQKPGHPFASFVLGNLFLVGRKPTA